MKGQKHLTYLAGAAVLLLSTSLLAVDSSAQQAQPTLSEL